MVQHGSQRADLIVLGSAGIFVTAKWAERGLGFTIPTWERVTILCVAGGEEGVGDGEGNGLPTHE